MELFKSPFTIVGGLKMQNQDRLYSKELMMKLGSVGCLDSEGSKRRSRVWRVFSEILFLPKCTMGE